jgi:hypothetical protein
MIAKKTTKKTIKPKETKPKRVVSTPPNSSKLTTKMIGASLERWRMEQQLTHAEGAEAFGLPIAKWYVLVNGDEARRPLSDNVLALTKCLYTNYPKSAPKQGRPDVRQFYEWLGLSDTRKDKEHFAWLIGRQAATVYRLLNEAGNPSRPLIRYIEALQQLGLDPESTLRIMRQIAKEALIEPSIQN